MDNASITAEELKRLYIDFFKRESHAEISGKSLIPENDPSALFTMAGMHPLGPYLTGEPHPAGKRLVNCQQCIRTGDIESVGDPSHCTYFEMLGNWSLGDYFKEESLEMSHRFLTGSLGLSGDSLSVTVFAGDERAPRDDEAAAIWKKLGIPDQRICFLSAKDNWWSLGGGSGPCGPDSEIFVDTGSGPCGPECRPGCSCGKYFEVWNNVFMQYKAEPDGTVTPLARRCVDTGMGVERTAAMLQGRRSVYDTEVFVPLISALEDIGKVEYRRDAAGHTVSGGESGRSLRIVAEHLRAASMILGDPSGILPSNVGQGYVLRRLVRRAARHGRKLGLEEPFLYKLAPLVIDSGHVSAELKNEEELFRDTLNRGEREFQKMLPNLRKGKSAVLPGRLAFKLYDTYGFPFELTEELAAEHGLSVLRADFDKAFAKHQELSRKGAEKSFKGGLADQSRATTNYHTATHLLHEALRRILGDHAEQKGSNITAERLRFDFTHPDAMTKGQIADVEEMVNEQIRGDLPVTVEEMTLEEAREIGARALFEGKYDEKVKVYRIGGFSAEVCGGPHAERTGNLGRFSIRKEQSSSRGVRRIRAVLEDASNK